MATFTVNKVKISGLSACVPATAENNSDYPYISDIEKDLLIKTTGIASRRVASKDITTSDLCVKAAEKLLHDLSWNKNDIDLLVFVSQSRDYFLPSTSIIVQDRLKITKNCMAFDVGLGCSGFTHGLGIAGSMMQSGAIKKALLMVGDISTCTLSKEDKSTYPLFGDAACVIAIEYSENTSPWYFNAFSDGSGHQAIIIPDGCLRNPPNTNTYEVIEVEKGIKRHRMNLWLNGLDVFAFSVKEVPLSVNYLMEFAHHTKEEIDFFVMHQANLLMNETIRKKLKFEAEKVPYSLHEFGNTSSASIPLTIISRLQNEIQSGKTIKLLLSGFGVGLSWSNVILELNNPVVSDIIEI